MAAHVVADHAQAGAEARHHGVPGPQVGAERAREHERAPRRLAVLAPADRGAGEVGHRHQ